MHHTLIPVFHELQITSTYEVCHAVVLSEGNEMVEGNEKSFRICFENWSFEIVFYVPMFRNSV